MRAAIGFIMVTITLDILGMSVVVPVLPPLIQSMEGGSAIAAAHAVGIFATAWALMQFIFSPVLGGLSDRFGRRPIILLSNLGLGLNYLLMALAPNVTWLFVGRVVSGITAASFSCASAYIADITPPDKRAARFGLISVAFGFGFIAGPVLGGLLGAINPRLPFWVSAGLSLTNFLFGWFVLPESLAPDKRAPWNWRRANPVGALQLLRSHPGLPSLATVGFLGLIAQNVLPTMTVLYAINRYHFTMHELSWMLGAMGLCSAFVGGLLTGRVVARIGERRALLLGLCCGVTGFVMMGLAPTGAMFLLALPVLSLRGMADPALSALMTRKVLAHEQGALQGAMSSLLGIAGLFAPVMFTESYAFFLQPHHGWDVQGVPYLISAILLLAAALLASWRIGWRPAVLVSDRLGAP
jgi:DHA1 family tetracycline resistance protein-like MFS transporter